MDDVVIKVKNLSKKYTIGEAKTAYPTLRDAISNWLKSPFRRFSPTHEPPTIWALKDVSFEVKRGEVLGIIGRNGAGKTTLLKILSHITEPTEGEVEIKGRISSLLEVGTGFHPELTGRENIYLNGAILGMHKAEINRKFDEIVAFAEFEKFIDTPVKYYSSGMYIRLGFSVAVHMDPEIFLIDEVLAVGDVSFQQKCLRKIQEIKNSGITVIFVSHNLEMVRRLCLNTAFLKRGEINFIGESQQAIEAYLKSISDFFSATYPNLKEDLQRKEEPIIKIEEIKLYDASGTERNEFKTGDYMRIEIHYFAKEKFFEPCFALSFFLEGQLFADHNNRFDGYNIKCISGKGKAKLIIENLLLLPGFYEARAHIADKDSIGIYSIKGVPFFVREGKRGFGLYYQPHSWEIEETAL